MKKDDTRCRLFLRNVCGVSGLVRAGCFASVLVLWAVDWASLWEIPAFLPNGTV